MRYVQAGGYIDSHLYCICCFTVAVVCVVLMVLVFEMAAASRRKVAVTSAWSV